MRKPVLIPASLNDGEAIMLTHGQWLCGQMRQRGVASGELFKRMGRFGYEAQSQNIVSMWRSDRCRIGLDCLPKLLEALGMGENEQRAWVVHFTSATYPALAPYLRRAA
jgi:hypothetical protein